MKNFKFIPLIFLFFPMILMTYSRYYAKANVTKLSLHVYFPRRFIFAALLFRSLSSFELVYFCTWDLVKV